MSPARRHFVSLATDGAPTYALLTPVSVRLWALRGWTPIVHVDAGAWSTGFGRLVISTIEALGGLVVPIDRCDPLSVANTMRVSRLLGAVAPGVEPDDFVMMADADIWPVSFDFFRPDDEAIHLRRPLWHVWTSPSAQLPAQPPGRLLPGEFRPAMCYSGAAARVWTDGADMGGATATDRLRSLLVDARISRIAGVNAALLDDAPHHVDLDERLVSRILLSHPLADGPCVPEAPGRWRQGSMLLTEPVGVPHLSEHRRLSPGLLLYTDWRPAAGGPMPAGLVDYIPPRAARGTMPWDCLTQIGVLWPDLEGPMTEYAALARDALACDREAVWPRPDGPGR